MVSGFRIEHLTSGSGRDVFEASMKSLKLGGKQNLQIREDILALEEMGHDAPVTFKRLTGAASVLWQLTVGNYRVFCALRGTTLWLIEAAKKNQQNPAIERSIIRQKSIP